MYELRDRINVLKSKLLGGIDHVKNEPLAMFEIIAEQVKQQARTNELLEKQNELIEEQTKRQTKLLTRIWTDQ